MSLMDTKLQEKNCIINSLELHHKVKRITAWIKSYYLSKQIAQASQTVYCIPQTLC